MARLLTGSGQRIALLVLLDSYPDRPRLPIGQQTGLAVLTGEKSHEPLGCASVEDLMAAPDLIGSGRYTLLQYPAGTAEDSGAYLGLRRSQFMACSSLFQAERCLQQWRAVKLQHGGRCPS